MSPTSIRSGHNEPSELNGTGQGNSGMNDSHGDSVRKASLAIRCEDIHKLLEETLTEVVKVTSSGNKWKELAHDLDNLYRDIQLWQFDIGMNVEVRMEAKQATKQASGDEEARLRYIDLTGYDVLEILHTHPDLNLFGDISREFIQLEKITEELKGRLAGKESRSGSDVDE
jgi:hypothetical protein